MVGVVVRCRWSWLIVGVGLDQEPDLYQMDGRHVELWRLLILAELRHWKLGQSMQMLCFVQYARVFVDGRDKSLLLKVFVQPVCGLQEFTVDNYAAGAKRRGMDLQTIEPS